MTQPASDAPRAETTIVVPHSQPMVALLGTQDEFMRLVENAFPAADIMARGNEITVSGSPEDVGVIDTLVGEMLAVLRTGQALSAESVERSIALMRSGTRPTEVLTANILSNRGRTIRARPCQALGVNDRGVGHRVRLAAVAVRDAGAWRFVRSLAVEHFEDEITALAPFALAHTFLQSGPFRPSNVDRRGCNRRHRPGAGAVLVPVHERVPQALPGDSVRA